MSTAGSLAKIGNKNPMYGKRAATYKGGKICYGYKMVYEPNHPLSQKNGYIYEHRLVVMNQLCRLLEKWEVVHHINHNKLDNRLENLIVIARSKHSSNHHKGEIKSLEHRKKLSDSKKGKLMPQYVKNKISKTLKTIDHLGKFKKGHQPSKEARLIYRELAYSRNRNNLGRFT